MVIQKNVQTLFQLYWSDFCVEQFTGTAKTEGLGSVSKIIFHSGSVSVKVPKPLLFGSVPVPVGLKPNSLI